MRQRGYRSTDLMSETGVSYWQLRRWVKQGLIPRATRGCQSLYPPEALERVRQVRDLYERTMTHRDIRDYFDPEPDDDDPEDAA